MASQGCPCRCVRPLPRPNSRNHGHSGSLSSTTRRQTPRPNATPQALAAASSNAPGRLFRSRPWLQTPPPRRAAAVYLLRVHCACIRAGAALAVHNSDFMGHHMATGDYKDGYEDGLVVARWQQGKANKLACRRSCGTCAHLRCCRL
jgi:hypothetical protein